MESLNQDIVNKILNFIKSKEIGASASEISRAIDHNRVTVSKYLEVMRARGLLSSKVIAQARLWAVSDDHRKPTILVVEDERNIIELVKLSLIPGQYNILEAMDGITALQLIKEHRPSLVLLDLMLPKLDGKEVCKIVKKDPGTQEIPIVMLTAKSQTIDKVEGLKIGADDYITKPFDPLELEARVESVIKRTNLHLTKNNVTGLPGISVLTEYLEDFDGDVIFVDIKNFSSYNKANGYKKGNELLQIVSRIIRHAIVKRGDKADLLAHLDSDNFVVLTKKMSDPIASEIMQSVSLFLPPQKGQKIKLVVKAISSEEVKEEIRNGEIEKIEKKAKIFK
ncbi:response regulator [Candidatus Woesearchaeota archaeon]|nr:response regulator [Candidatus Woesearchaeota archaeon]